jgi:hypothetical protein
MFPRLSQTELDKYAVFNNTFYGVAAGQTRNATDIINGNPNPGVDTNTFSSSGWPDYASIHAYWR